MISFFQGKNKVLYVAESNVSFTDDSLKKLEWLFEGKYLPVESLEGYFTGPRKEMITPWSTNAVEITINMGIQGITRIEEFKQATPDTSFDRMLQALYKNLDQEIFTIHHQPDPVIFIDNLKAYNESEGLALSDEEIGYLEGVSRELGRKLTDSEVFGFSQVNSEHCRHKIFNGTFILDGKEMPESLFRLIRRTSEENPNLIVSAYKDNVAFLQGPVIQQFAPVLQDRADYFSISDFESVISLKAETHNFPTTVEPFNGASTGSGGEIRDRMAGGKGSIPLAGTAVYMTSYSRLEENRPWEKYTKARNWLYQTPLDILIKASNGASDFGNKFGQPLLCGSVFTFEFRNSNTFYGYDKVIMLAGGVGFGKKSESAKGKPSANDQVILLGGDNYRIGMGGGAVSSVATGEYGNSIELNAVQRANPEMQKRVYNAIRAMTEADKNPLITVHDHGAGGHLNCFSELAEELGGTIHLDQLPIGDPTLSAREIIGNESQERMGMVVSTEKKEYLKNVSLRERAPYYEVGSITGDRNLLFDNRKTGEKPINWKIEYLFGKPPRTIIRDQAQKTTFAPARYNINEFRKYLGSLLQMEAVACKDWLTNKVDRSVTGKVAKQQTCGKLQLPLNNLAVVSLDYTGQAGIATSLGHAPVSGLIDVRAGSELSVTEALTNIIWAPLTHGIKGISLSANWMWPSKNPGEDVRLYEGVKALSEFSIALGINVPTGKDSLSMTQKYPDGEPVLSPGTVIVSAAAEVSDITRVVEPVLKHQRGSLLIYVDFSLDKFHLGGSSFGQLMGNIGNTVPGIKDTVYLVKAFSVIQEMVKEGVISAGHDISSGGMITTLLEMTFPSLNTGMDIDLSSFEDDDPVRILFSEKPGVIIQASENGPVIDSLKSNGLSFRIIGKTLDQPVVRIRHNEFNEELDVKEFRDIWFKTSWLLDRYQSKNDHADIRYKQYKNQPLEFIFPSHFIGKISQFEIQKNRRKPTGIKAAIIREKGVNGDREMAWSMYLAGFDVKDVHMTDLISGREKLEDVHFIVFVGGFSNSDVLGSAKGWAGAFLYNPKAQQALDNFYRRDDTLSLGVCNGCQLMVELGLIYPDMQEKPRMRVNSSGKFESSFISMDILSNHSVMLSSLAGSRLGAWVAHGEGRFELNLNENEYHIPAKFHYKEYPGNPNGSQYGTACIASHNGRHLAIMPHLERSLYPWNWGYYPDNREKDEISPWIEAFVNARNWVKSH